MNNITKKELLTAIKTFIDYELGNIRMNEYTAFINNIQKDRGDVSTCNTCPSLNRKIHSDFQQWVWSKAAELYPQLIPKLPEFKTYQYQGAYYQKQIQILSFKKLQEHIQLCNDKAGKIRNNKLLSDYYREDAKLIFEYKTAKMSYFLEGGHKEMLDMIESKKVTTLIEPDIVEVEQETNTEVRKGGRHKTIDDIILKQMKSEGKTNKAISEYFNVSTAAISKAWKQLKERENEQE